MHDDAQEEHPRDRVQQGHVEPVRQEPRKQQGHTQIHNRQVHEPVTMHPLPRGAKHVFIGAQGHVLGYKRIERKNPYNIIRLMCCWSTFIGWFLGSSVVVTARLIPLTPPSLSFTQLVRGLEHSAFNHVYFAPDLTSVTVTTAEPEHYQFISKIPPLLTERLVDLSLAHDVDTVFTSTPWNPLDLLPTLFYPLLIFSLLRYVSMVGGIMGMGMGMRGGGPFSGRGDRMEIAPSNVTFRDWIGSPEVLEECIEFVSYLNNDTFYRKIGAQLPRGILLEGPPGTGKTLLAKALAAESNSSFLSVSGSEFIEMFVGVGAQRVRQLFDDARANTPCIIFIDEIDAIGKQRGGRDTMSGGNDERDQTLNQLLTEMDGFRDNVNITVLAATNRADILDKALLRPGRFDRTIRIPLPDASSRQAMLRHYVRDRPVDSTVQYEVLGEMTSGYSGADIQNLVNEAAILAARRRQLILTQALLVEAVEKRTIGIKKRVDTRDETTRRRVAVHEMGHALLCDAFPDYFDLQKVSIEASYSGIGGFTLFTENYNISESRLYTRDFLKKRLMVALGGKAAEAVVYGDDFVSVGASQDLAQANALARNMIETYGMGRRLLTGTSASKSGSKEVEAEIAALLEEAYQNAHTYLRDHRSQMDVYVQTLLDTRVLSAEQFHHWKRMMSLSSVVPETSPASPSGCDEHDEDACTCSL